MLWSRPPHPESVYNIAARYIFLYVFLLTRFVLHKLSVCESVCLLVASLRDMLVVNFVINS